jgi:hypothetical protein
MLSLLERDVGGPEALAQLDDVPLPDEPFDWTGIADDIRDRVSEVLMLADACCDELLDVEYRTAARRVLARVATNGPEVFRRRGGANTAAGAICWWLCQINTTRTVGGRRLSQKALLGYLGIRSGGIASRAGTLLESARLPSYVDEFGREITVASPEYLVSAGRREILARRARYEAET